MNDSVFQAQTALKPVQQELTSLADSSTVVSPANTAATSAASNIAELSQVDL